MSQIQYSNETCGECGEPTTVTPDPYGDGSPYEFSVTCSANQNHNRIKSYAHDRPAPVFTIALPKLERVKRARREPTPVTPRTPAQSSLIALLLKGR